MAQARARPEIPAMLLSDRVMAIARGLRRAELPGLADALGAGGIRVLEVTLNSPDALGAIADLAATAGERMLVGAGTVLDLSGAEAAVEAGARFLVMPHLDPELVRWCAARGIPAFPGAMTPTEVLGAWRAGAAAVKVFPAATLGPRYVRELRAPLDEVLLVPTGGVSADNAAEFLAAGAVAVAAGGWLIGDGEATGVAERAAALVAASR
jgi:2-dehydro-3-deoxyphosphogluconate aldolase / (4S)-4-hydroxy-2-oxoglutarate aldolase